MEKAEDAVIAAGRHNYHALVELAAGYLSGVDDDGKEWDRELFDDFIIGRIDEEEKTHEVEMHCLGQPPLLCHAHELEVGVEVEGRQRP